MALMPVTAAAFPPMAASPDAIAAPPAVPSAAAVAAMVATPGMLVAVVIIAGAAAPATAAPVAAPPTAPVAPATATPVAALLAVSEISAIFASFRQKLHKKLHAVGAVKPLHPPLQWRWQQGVTSRTRRKCRASVFNNLVGIWLLLAKDAANHRCYRLVYALFGGRCAGPKRICNTSCNQLRNHRLRLPCTVSAARCRRWGDEAAYSLMPRFITGFISG